MEKFFIYLKNRLINDYQFNEIDLKQQYENWIKTRGENKISKSDFYWSCLNIALSYYAKNSKTLEDMYKVHREINLLMFEFLRKEKRNVTHIQKEINRIDISLANHHKFEVNVCIISGNRCEYAKQFNGIKFSMKTVLNIFPIDYNKCDRIGGCVCSVGFEGKRGIEGKLIMKKSENESL